MVKDCDMGQSQWVESLFAFQEKCWQKILLTLQNNFLAQFLIFNIRNIREMRMNYSGASRIRNSAIKGAASNSEVNISANFPQKLHEKFAPSGKSVGDRHPYRLIPSARSAAALPLTLFCDKNLCHVIRWIHSMGTTPNNVNVMDYRILNIWFWNTI